MKTNCLFGVLFTLLSLFCLVYAPAIFAQCQGNKPLITGSDNVLNNDRIQIYQIPEYNKSCEWNVVGGTILSGLNTNQITVEWQKFGSNLLIVDAFILCPTNNKLTAVSNSLTVVYNPISTTNQFVAINDISIKGTRIGHLNSQVIYSIESPYEKAIWGWKILSDEGTIVSREYSNTIQVVWKKVGKTKIVAFWNDGNGSVHTDTATVFVKELESNVTFTYTLEDIKNNQFIDVKKVVECLECYKEFEYFVKDEYHTPLLHDKFLLNGEQTTIPLTIFKTGVYQLDVLLDNTIRKTIFIDVSI